MSRSCLGVVGDETRRSGAVELTRATAWPLPLHFVRLRHRSGIEKRGVVVQRAAAKIRPGLVARWRKKGRGQMHTRRGRAELT